jgi:MinD-like ATPase involved in chromosome partitioning or flagellar assembly
MTSPAAALRVFAIASGKGGVGKSFLAANLGWSLVELAQRVLLVEADQDAGSLSLACGLGEAPQRAPANSAAELSERVVAVPGNAQLYLLRASDVSAQLLRSPNALLSMLTETCAQLRVGCCLVDLPPGIGAAPVLWLQRAHGSLLVGTPELVCVHAMLRLHKQLQCQHAFDWLRTREPALQTCGASLALAKQRLFAVRDAAEAQQLWREAFSAMPTARWIFNRCLPDDTAQLARIQAHVQRQAGAAQFDCIPEDGAQVRCARYGRLLLRYEAISPAAAAVRTLAGALSAQLAPPAAKTVQQAVA